MFTILQIDDLEAMRGLMKVMLEKRPRTQLIAAASGLEGIAAAQAEKPDLILLDVDMPGMRGPEVLTRLKADPNTAQIPVVVVSGSAEQDVIDSMLTGGALLHLAKPFSLQALFKMIEAFDPTP